MITRDTLKVRQFLEAKKMCPVLQVWWMADHGDHSTEFICNHMNQCEVCQVALVVWRMEK